MIFLDVETKFFFREGEDVNALGDLQVSFAGAYDSESEKFYSFWENDLKDFEKLLLGADRIVGYNIWHFDYGVLQPYFDQDPHNLPTLDLMIAMKKIVGFRPKLDTLAKANLGTGKIGSGWDAGEYWKRGELDKLEKYCLEDVRLTYEVWKKGEEDGKLKYYGKSGFLREAKVNWEEGFVQRLEEEKSSQVTLL